jgi:hypothetical protein
VDQSKNGTTGEQVRNHQRPRRRDRTQPTAVILQPSEYPERSTETERPPVPLLRKLPEENLVIDSPDVAMIEKIESIPELAEPGLFDGIWR